MGIKDELAKTEFYNREYSFSHIPYDKEMAFYQSIRNGDMEEMQRLFTPLCVEGFGKLSENPLRNLKYHLIITIAFITRYCIEGGLEMESAYNLSDIYIRKIDTCNSQEEIHDIHKELCESYVKRMQKCRSSARYSKAVQLTIDYIYDNLHEKILIADIAEKTKLSQSYISRLFHKETGVSISTYIINKRVEAAKNLLIYTDYSTSEISNFLNFSSESHFISTFKKVTNQTPKKYRLYNFRNNDQKE
ncbi:MAG: helix-turn-helix domain-containing protein [Treponema sp.]|nr:helix-turn-helix domain-containing protein [Treponema sp.]